MPIHQMKKMKEFLTEDISKEAKDKKNLVYKLLQPPNGKLTKKEQGQYITFVDGHQMCDLMFFNQNRDTENVKTGERYLLTVTDLHSKNTDFEEIKGKTAEDVIFGYNRIYGRSYLPKPYLSITSDGGGEFNNAKFKKWLKTKQPTIPIIYNATKAGAKRKNAQIESVNRIISGFLSVITTQEQMKKMEEDKKLNLPEVIYQKEWVKHLKKLREFMNKDLIYKMPNIVDFWKIKPQRKMYKIGDMVYVQTEKPLGLIDEKLKGTYRLGDFYYEKTPKKIINIFHPRNGKDPRYFIEGEKNISFTYHQLMKP